MLQASYLLIEDFFQLLQVISPDKTLRVLRDYQFRVLEAKQGLLH
jgi:hypothetical protein